VRSIERGAVLAGKYRIDSIIGHGGMGLVVKACHLGLNEDVAIKMLRDDVAVADETIARFLREAQAAVKLKGEHVARIIDVGTFGSGRPYMVMEFLEGQDIGQLLAERCRLQPSLAIELVIQACVALAEAHSLGIVHRDIKPTNLFLTSHPDGSLLLKVLDFGISKSSSGAELSLTQTWSVLGSPAYMSPEQMRSARHVDARTDVWSLGAVLYEAVEGRLPFQADSFSEVCVMVAVDPPAPMTATPRELVPIISRCLAKNPDDRYPNVAELARELARVAREPDKSRVLVDRMFRMLGRGVVRRTPAAGVPHAPFLPRLDGTPPPWPRARALAPFGELDPGQVAAEPIIPPMPRLPARNDLPPVLPMPLAPRDPRAALPFAHAAPSRPPSLAPGSVVPAGQAPAGRSRPRRAPSLTATHVIARSRRSSRSWLITVVTAILALAAAAAVAAATRAESAPAPASTTPASGTPTAAP
jgi:eukaryotic-like serine/threonine-protein kinase